MNYELSNGRLSFFSRITQKEFDDICNRNVFTELDCWNCLLLTNLPDMPLLTELSCRDCPRLTNFPDMPLLTILWCNNFPLLTKSNFI